MAVDLDAWDAWHPRVLAARLVLLFKAKGDRAKDRADLHAVLPLLDAHRRRWLVDALATVHPGHPWRGLLVE